MANGFAETYRVVSDLPPGDALRAQRALTAEGVEVALKTVRPVAPDMFVRALARVAGVAGPHIEHVLAWEEQGGFVSLATAPVAGTDLGRVLAEAGALAPQSAAALGAQAALGLAGLHEHGIVHGGVKPGTLVQTAEGVVLVDAGLAQAQGAAELSEQAAPRHAAYVSPEEALGRPLLPASDVYSLGVVLYQLVTGRLPFAGQNAWAVAQDHIGAPVIPPRQLNPALSIGLEDVILRALAKAPEDRYATGRVLFRALENELQATQVLAPPASTPAARPARQIWPWVVAGVVALAVIVAVLWATGVFTPKSTVPNIVGTTLSSASTTLSTAGFKLGTVGYQQGLGKPQGTILAQDPGAGAKAKKGAAVNLVAVGTTVETVPDVTGMTQAAASDAIAAAGLALGHVTLIYSGTAPSGTVADQAPDAGVTAPAGSQIAITVSQGPTPSALPSATGVPNVIGENQTQAVAALQAAGFAVVVEQIFSATVPAGTVTDQTPASGVLAQPGATVTVIVSTGSATTSPNP